MFIFIRTFISMFLSNLLSNLLNFYIFYLSPKVTEFCKTDLPKGIFLDKATGLPWVLPKEGIVKLHVQYECDIPSRFNVGAQNGTSRAIIELQSYAFI